MKLDLKAIAADAALLKRAQAKARAGVKNSREEKAALAIENDRRQEAILKAWQKGK